MCLSRKISSLAKRMANTAINPDKMASIVNDRNYPNFEHVLSTNEPDHFRESTNEEAEMLRSRSHVLGSFTYPQSPPIISLNEKNLTSFYIGAMERVFGPRWQSQNPPSLEFAKLVAWKTFYHELFHYHSWYFREIISKAPHNHYIEEALAVAFGYHSLIEKEKYLLKHQQSQNFLDEIHKYTGDGYRDWIRYKKKTDLEKAMKDYFIGQLNTTKYKDWNILKTEKDLYKSIVHQNGSYFFQIV